MSENDSGAVTDVLAGLNADRTAHLCVDMQRLFGPQGPWPTPWMERVLPLVETLVRARPAQTVFTRFMPPFRACDAQGQWQAFYQRWHQVTREQIDADLIDLMPSLRQYVPPAQVIDKPGYSPFFNSDLQRLLQKRNIDTLVISGAETDVCVLAAVLAAVDRGYRVVVARDALCSGNDATHDALMKLYEQRFSAQIELAPTGDILDCWR
jgi:nicotinamidase-related amidase